jgi:UDP-N-acetylglucosamine:LPS N-acetylglucosamine transferase
MPDLLILTARTGGGHVSLAEALRDLLAAHAHIEIVDPFPRVVRLHYRLVSRHAPALWAAEYALTNRPLSALAAHQLSARLLAHSLDRVLRRRRYNMVITTFPFLSYEVRRAIERLPRPSRFAMLLTDPDRLHASWLTERGASATFAPTYETYAQARAAGFPSQRLYLTGWPVRRQFYAVDPGKRAATLVRLGFDPHRLTVFAQGGGEGSAGFARSVEIALTAAPDQIQVILAAGTNHRLIKRFSGVAQVRTVAYTPEIASIMAAADVVMGKAGPNMLFEATTLGKPFIATTYIPGQEGPNLAFIQTHRLGWVALEARALRALIAALASDPAHLLAMEETVKSYGAWNATATSVIATRVRALMG